MEESFSTNKAPKPVGMYPHARKAGNLLFLSGVGPRIAGSGQSDSEVPGLILEESGSSWGELIDVTVFLVNMKRDFHTYNQVYAEYFKENLPCRTTVEINSLPTPIAIELKCVATIK